MCQSALFTSYSTESSAFTRFILLATPLETSPCVLTGPVPELWHSCAPDHLSILSYLMPVHFYLVSMSEVSLLQSIQYFRTLLSGVFTTHFVLKTLIRFFSPLAFPLISITYPYVIFRAKLPGSHFLIFFIVCYLYIFYKVLAMVSHISPTGLLYMHLPLFLCSGVYSFLSFVSLSLLFRVVVSSMGVGATLPGFEFQLCCLLADSGCAGYLSSLSCHFFVCNIGI